MFFNFGSLREGRTRDEKENLPIVGESSSAFFSIREVIVRCDSLFNALLSCTDIESIFGG